MESQAGSFTHTVTAQAGGRLGVRELNILKYAVMGNGTKETALRHPLAVCHQICRSEPDDRHLIPGGTPGTR